MKQRVTSFGAAFDDGDTARRAAFSAAVDYLEDFCIVTVDAAALIMNFTEPSSLSNPLVIVQGRVVLSDCGEGNWEMTAVAGPGQTVSADLLTSAKIIAWERVTGNRIARKGN